MESDVVSIALPNGEILQLKTDGSDFKEFSTEKKGMICAYLKGLLKTKESFITYGVSQDEYLCDLFVQLVKQLRSKYDVKVYQDKIDAIVY